MKFGTQANPSEPPAAAERQDELGIGPAIPGPATLRRFNRAAILGSVAVALLAVAGLLAYLPGLRTFGSIRPPDYIPMAPSTAWCLLILGASVFGHTRAHLQRRGRTALAGLVLLVMFFGFLEAVQPWLGIELEGWFVSEAGKLGAIPIGRMSPATGVELMLAALGTFLLLLSPGAPDSQRLGHSASTLGVLTLLIAATVLLAYLYGEPLMYDGTTIPMAATTALAFMFLGTALAAATGPNSFPLYLVAGSSTAARLSRRFLPLAALAVLLQGLLHEFVEASFGGHDVLFLAAILVGVVMVTMVVIARVANTIGRHLDEFNNRLQESEARFRSLLDLSSDWYWEQDEQFRFIKFSGGERQGKWGQDQRRALGLRRWELPEITPVGGSWNEHQAVLEAHQPFRHFEYRRDMDGGKFRYLATSGEPMFDASGRFTGYRGVASDITGRKEAEHKITRLNRVYAVLSGINSLIVREGDRDTLFRGACRIAVEDGSFLMAWIGLVDRSTMELVPVAAAGTTQDPATLVNQRFSLLEEAPLGNTFSARAIRERKPFFSNDVQNDPAVAFKAEHAQRGSRSAAMLPLVVSGEAIGVLGLYADETGFFDEAELKLLTELTSDIAFAIDHIEKEAKLNYLAYYDPLTGLANRTLFLERVAQYLRSAANDGHQMAVALIDLERFKNINDSLGQRAGDALLKQVAEWMTGITGDPSLLAHVGADHFAGVLPLVKPGGNVLRLLEKTMAVFMNHPFILDDGVFRLAAKVGVAVFPEDGIDADTLFRNAEAALKRAKASGSRYLFYTQQMTAAVASKLTLENQLRQALDNEEFVLHYQPKINLASGKITGAEALIRWNDPRTGLVPPGHFIPCLEETGLIYEVGRWALRQAVADYLRWRAAGLPAVRIAVNVSPLQLRHRGFVAEIEQAIGSTAQAADGLELEITESLIMEDVRHNIASLQAIRDMGVSIAIDDFGTGFSSLSYLAKLPVDTLKIDRSFIIDMTTAPEGLALVSTIIKLAQAMHLKVVAEGVETEEQQRLLRLLGCDEMQGYLFSKPVPSDIFEARFMAPQAVGQ